MIGNDIDKAIQLLQAGELVAIPTETVYGLAANAFNSDAVASIFKAKNRPFFDPLIVHTNSIANISGWVEDFPENAKILAKSFWPGPLTLVLKKKDSITDIVTAGNETVAIRIPNHPITLELLGRLDFPVAAPSANPFGYVSPTTAKHVEDQLGNKIPYILDGGNSTVGIESTIISFATETPTVLRLGGIAIEIIEDIIGKVNININQNSNPQAPGQIDSHYAPSTRFIVGEIPKLKPSDTTTEEVGVITLSKQIDWALPQNQVQLSKNNDLNEAASNIFAAMRILDKKKLKKILAEPMPNEGLGLAINDRLNRAAYKL